MSGDDVNYTLCCYTGYDTIAYSTVKLLSHFS